MRLLFSFAGGEGHLQPLLPLARAAAEAGHEVAVGGAAALAGVAAGLAYLPSGPDVVAQWVPLKPVDPEHEIRAIADSFAGWMARRRAADLIGLCERWRPDVLVRDELDFGAAVAAERLGIPHATVLVIAAGGFVRPDVVAGPLDRLRAEHGLAADPDLAAARGRLVLSPFPPSFREPAHAANGFRPYEVDRRAAGRAVYVTLGTIFNTESGDLLARVLAGVRELPVPVVVTVGRARDPAELGSQPANVHLTRYVPQSLLLPECAAVVSHAGSGSVTAALAHGLPVVCIPLGADQPRNAARCTTLGAGLALDAVTATPAAIRTATAAVLTEPAYREAARRLQAEVAALPSPADAVTLLERL